MRAFKFIKQLDSMQCGLACMAMICYHWRRTDLINTIRNFNRYSFRNNNRHYTANSSLPKWEW